MEMLRAKVDQLEREIESMKIQHGREIKALRSDMKDQDQRIRNTELSVSRIEIVVDSLKGSWQSLENKLDKVIENGSSSGYKMSSEILKWSTVIVAAILGAKIFL